MESTLASKSNYANLLDAIEMLTLSVDRERIFFLHKDWLDHDSAGALRSLEKFLEVPAGSLGQWPERGRKASRWKTDICTTPRYFQIKERLEAQFRLVMALLSEQGHWIPPSMLDRRSACEVANERHEEL